MTNAEEPTVLTPNEVAQILRINKNLVYELLRSKQIPSIKLGNRKIVIPRKALDKLLEEAGSAWVSGS